MELELELELEFELDADVVEEDCWSAISLVLARVCREIGVMESIGVEGGVVMELLKSCWSVLVGVLRKCNFLLLLVLLEMSSTGLMAPTTSMFDEGEGEDEDDE